MDFDGVGGLGHRAGAVFGDFDLQAAGVQEEELIGPWRLGEGREIFRLLIEILGALVAIKARCIAGECYPR